MAHDFNNLLIAIQGYTEFVMDSLEHQMRDDQTCWRCGRPPNAPRV